MLPLQTRCLRSKREHSQEREEKENTKAIQAHLAVFGCCTFALLLARNMLAGIILVSAGPLETIYLFDNHFAGALPDRLGLLLSLKRLDLDSNTLSGSIPSSISSTLALEGLLLGYGLRTEHLHRNGEIFAIANWRHRPEIAAICQQFC